MYKGMDGAYIIFFTCSGRLHYVQIFWCKCIPLSVSLVRCGFWPAMPENPSVGFAWDLLEMLRALMLECQISVQGFCRALRCKSNLTDSEVNHVFIGSLFLSGLLDMSLQNCPCF